jgi:hypothetical protein
LAVAKKALIGVMEINCPMTDDTKAAGLVTVALALDMDPRDKHEDDNSAGVCRCAPRLVLKATILCLSATFPLDRFAAMQ